MTAQEFDTNLRALVRREPFQPFVIEIIDGDRIQVETPAVFLGRGSAVYRGPDKKLHIIDSAGVRAFVQSPGSGLVP